MNIGSDKYWTFTNELITIASLPDMRDAEKLFGAFSIAAKSEWCDLARTATELCVIYDIKYLDGEFLICMNDEETYKTLTTRKAVLTRLLEVLVPRIRPTADELEGFVQGFIEDKAGDYVYE